MLQLILEKKIKTRGVLRPIEPQVYVPGNHKFTIHSFSFLELVLILLFLCGFAALDILQAYGLKLLEKTE